MDEISIKDFLETEYSNSALYNCYRAIASYVDGLKPSARKVVYTIKKRNMTQEMKVSRFASSVAEQSEYLHGESSMQGVIVNLTQDFVGSNNLPLLQPNGNFGSRHIPASSAARYIFTQKSEEFDKMFNKADDAVLISQEFEGAVIEPKYYVPILPLLLVNGSEGMGTGFAQKILPRNPTYLRRAIVEYLGTGEITTSLTPFYRGFSGRVRKGDKVGSWEIYGKFTVKNTANLIITELPVGYSLAGYLKVLNKLEEDKVINGFEDLSEDDKFLFNIKVPRTFTKLPEPKMYDKLKLIKKVTENYTCMDENNCIRVFESVEDIIKAYVDIRVKYYEQRRLILIQQTKEDIMYLLSTKIFTEGIFSEKIKINNISKKQIETQLKSIEGLEKKADSYDYLLKMPLYSLTKEKIIQLKAQIKEKKEKHHYYTKATPAQLWEVDLEGYFEKR